MNVRRLAAFALVALALGSAFASSARAAGAPTAFESTEIARATLVAPAAIAPLRFASAATLLAAPAASAAQAGNVPANDGWVTDLAGMLTAQQEHDLEASMEAYKRGSGHDIALLTVPSLGGASLEEFSLAVAREWKLGDPKRNDGALLLVARDERKLRIEVGDGLEGSLTDARCARIIRDTLTPFFRAGKFDEGLAAGIAAIQQAAGGAPESAQRSIPQPAQHDVSVSIGELLCPLVLFVLVIFVIAFLRRLGAPWFFGGRPRRRWYGGSSTRGPGGFGGFGGFGGGFGGGGIGGGFSGFGGGGRFSGGGSSGGW